MTISIATVVLAKVQEYGTVVTSNICPGSFPHLAADNNDINEETLDAKIQQTQGQWWFNRENSLDLNHPNASWPSWKETAIASDQ